MALEKRIETGAVTVLADGQLQVRTDTVVLEDGIELSRSFHRQVIDPTSDRAALAGRIRAIADAVWTPAVVAARRAVLDRLAQERRATASPPARP